MRFRGKSLYKNRGVCYYIYKYIIYYNKGVEVYSAYERTVMTENSYNASQIQVLEGLEAVRRRPGMYIGSTDSRGLHHLVQELVDNSIDEALAGFCNEITVTIHEDGSCSVRDNGRGIPVDNHPKYNKPAVEVALTVLHAGGKFGGGGYKVSGGLHGVGLSVVNALATDLHVEISRNGKIYSQDYKRGDAVDSLKVIGESEHTGTFVQFWPDPEIFETTIFEYDNLKTRLRELAFLNKGVRITIKDEREDAKKQETFHYEGGIIEFVDFLNKNKTLLFERPLYFEGKKGTSSVEVAMQYNDGYNEVVLSFANNIQTHEGGTHLTGFRNALTKTLNDYARKYKLLKDKDANLSGDDVREGLCAVISVKLEEPQFEGQTKTKLGNSEIRNVTETIVSEKLEAFLEENPPVAKGIIEKCLMPTGQGKRQEKPANLRVEKTLLTVSLFPENLPTAPKRTPQGAKFSLLRVTPPAAVQKRDATEKHRRYFLFAAKFLTLKKQGLTRCSKTRKSVR